MPPTTRSAASRCEASWNAQLAVPPTETGDPYTRSPLLSTTPLSHRYVAFVRIARVASTPRSSHVASWFPAITTRCANGCRPSHSLNARRRFTPPRPAPTPRSSVRMSPQCSSTSPAGSRSDDVAPCVSDTTTMRSGAPAPAPAATAAAAPPPSRPDTRSAVDAAGALGRRATSARTVRSEMETTRASPACCRRQHGSLQQRRTRTKGQKKTAR
mmetsp:Transcript_24007/g.83301  ORF Transcript_24007/g.83301 Transcript_24007/m.83301 type:complete len:214 (+) Transcript_24007:482-1123(+)